MTRDQHSNRSRDVERAGPAHAATRCVPYFLVWLTLTSCSVARRVDDCNAIAETVRDQLSAVEVRLPGADDNASTYREIAAAYEALAWQLKRIEPADPALGGALTSYVESIERAGRHCRSYARALDQPTKPRKTRKRRKERLDRIRGQVKSERTRHASVHRKLSSICHPR